MSYYLFIINSTYLLFQTKNQKTIDKYIKIVYNCRAIENYSTRLPIA